MHLLETIFNRQVCWTQLPMSHSHHSPYPKAARDSSGGCFIKAAQHFIAAWECQIDVRLQNICWSHEMHNRWQVPCHNVQDLNIFSEKVKNFKGPGPNLNLRRWKAVNMHRYDNIYLHTAHLQLIQNSPHNTLSSATIKNIYVSLQLFYLTTSANPVPE